MNRDELILEWDKAKKELARLKVLEMELRNEIIKNDFTPIEGTQNVDLGGGYKLKAVFKTTYSFRSKEELDVVLSMIEKIGPEGEYIAERLIKFKPELSVSEYKKLDEQYKSLIDQVIITKPATPSLELVIPKDI
jgi:hypothetical protein